ncbi:MAG: 4Fe-4S binding protein [Marinilabiliaceae bacterium]|nr:4Fe-4S binding protein [Marinilabiliaceae bacterium]
MRHDTFYHALKVDAEKCFGCTHCMNQCPTSAIRIKDGIADIRKDWCVDCGECMRACPVDAIYVEQDDFETIFDYKYRVLLIPSVFIGQFSKHIRKEEIVSILHDLGFTHVYQVEYTADIVNQAMLKMAETKGNKPHISPFCPAIVRLIQVRFPSLTDNILTIMPPIDASAIFYKELLLQKGIPSDEIGMFYVTPCAAKIAAANSPVGEDKSHIDGVINMDFLYNKVFHYLKQNPDPDRGKDLNVPDLYDKGILWSLTNGEADNMLGRCIAIDEIHNVIEFLERLETTDEIQNVDFLELRACDQSCAGGVLMAGNRFLTIERLKKRAQAAPSVSLIQEDEKYREALNYLEGKLQINKIPPRTMQPFGSEMEEAMKRMEQVRNMMCFLPGIDCGACGAPNCQSLAQDITRREAQLSNCVFLQRMMEKNKKLNSDHAIRIIEKTWGKDRLDKDCRKKGAKYEGM